jgi:hypothetical protein
MKYGELSLAGVIVLALIGIRNIPTAGKQQSAVDSVEKTPGAEVQSRTPPVWRTLCKLSSTFGADPDIDEAAEAIPEGGADPACLSKLPRNSIVSVIATVPDPIGTNLGLMTDRTIEAIQVAAAETGYIPYLEGLPWSVQMLGSTDFTNGGSDSFYSAGARNEAGSKNDQQYPGILVLRRPYESEQTAAGQPRYLAVFLVAETPTSGLNKEQLFTALRIIIKIAPPSDISPRTVLIAGPYFSGSVDSLKEIANTIASPAATGDIQFAATPYPVHCIQAFSGTITNGNLDGMKPVDAKCGPALFNTQTDDTEALGQFQNWAEGLGYHHIAILTEEGTKYGQAEDNNDKIIRLHFPRGIAALRNATDPGQKITVTTGGPQRLPLRWQDVQPKSGETPLYGAYQTSLSQETVLAGLSETLRNEDIRILGIMATDPWDVTFLIHWFTEASPNVRVFVRDSDLLYLRTPDVGSVTGVIALTDQPLVGADRFGKSGSHHFVTFPSSSEEAQYNAFNILLKRLKPSIGGKDVKTNEGVVFTKQASDPLSVRQLWLAATSTQGFLPLGPLPETGTWPEMVSTHALQVGPPPYSAIILFVLIAGCAIVHAIVILVQDRNARGASSQVESVSQKTSRELVVCFQKLRACMPASLKPSAHSPKKVKECIDWRRVFPPILRLTFDVERRNDPITAAKLLCHAMALSTAALAVLIAAGSFVFFWRSGYHYMILAPFVLLVECLLFDAVRQCFRSANDAWTSGDKLASERSENDRQKAEAEAFLGVPRLRRASFYVAAVAWISAGVWSWSIWNPNLKYAFMHYRDLHLASGIAPAIPLLTLILVVHLGIWVYLRRLSCWEYGYVKMPVLGDEIFPSDCNPEVERISRAMLNLPEKPWAYMLFICPFLALLLFRPWNTMDMLEPSWVKWFTIVWFFLALSVLSVNWFRFLFTWQEMQEFLHKLERLPMRTAFARIAEQSTLSIWGWNVVAGKLLPTREAVETLKELTRLTNLDYPVSAESRNQLFSAIYNTYPIDKLGAAPWTKKQLSAQAIDPASATAQVEESANREAEAQAQPVSYAKAVGGESLTVASENRISGASLSISAAVANMAEAGRDAKNYNSSTDSAGNDQGGNEPRNHQDLEHDTVKDRLWQMREAMTRVLDQLVLYLLNHWRDAGDPEDAGPVNNPGPVDLMRRKGDLENRAFALAENLIALRFYSYIRYVGTELRRLLMFVVIAFSLIFLALQSYAFRACRALDLSFITLFGLLGIGVILMLGQQERNILLSKLQKTTEGELGGQFYLDVLKYAAVPTLALLVSQVPSISNFVLRWVQPSLDAFR